MCRFVKIIKFLTLSFAAIALVTACSDRRGFRSNKVNLSDLKGQGGDKEAGKDDRATDGADQGGETDETPAGLEDTQLTQEDVATTQGALDLLVIRDQGVLGQDAGENNVQERQSVKAHLAQAMGKQAAQTILGVTVTRKPLARPANVYDIGVQALIKKGADFLVLNASASLEAQATSAEGAEVTDFSTFLRRISDDLKEVDSSNINVIGACLEDQDCSRVTIVIEVEQSQGQVVRAGYSFKVNENTDDIRMTLTGSSVGESNFLTYREAETVAFGGQAEDAEIKRDSRISGTEGQTAEVADEDQLSDPEPEAEQTVSEAPEATNVESSPEPESENGSSTTGAEGQANEVEEASLSEVEPQVVKTAPPAPLGAIETKMGDDSSSSGSQGPAFEHIGRQGDRPIPTISNTEPEIDTNTKEESPRVRPNRPPGRP